MKKGNKKAEGFLGMGFGMIFSIFLIIIFIIVAIYAISTFLDYKNCSQVGIFMKDIQEEIDIAFNSQSTDFNFQRNLPTKIEFICFGNLSKSIKGSNEAIGRELSRYGIDKNNIFFYPRENACIKTTMINHLNITSITKKDNPYCIPVIKGKVSIRISRGFNEGLVRIS